MEETYPTKAIILKREDFRERDSKVALYSIDKGLMSLIARGTKKISSKLAGHIEPITMARIMVIRGKRWNYIGSVVSDDSFAGIKSNLEKIEAAAGAMRIILKEVKELEKDEVLFELILEFLNILNQRKVKPADSQLLLHFFILKFLVVLGFKPELNHCVSDKKPIKQGKNCFDLKQGGLVCGQCLRGKDHLAISNDCIKILRLAIKDDFIKLNKINISKNLSQETIKIVSAFYKYQTFF